VEDALAPVTLAYLPSLEGVDLRLTAWDAEPEAAAALLAAAAGRLAEPIGDHCYGEGETDLAAVLLEECRRQELTLAVAESCTGGMVGERITAIAGSSDVFLGGVIAYANAVKERDLGVDRRILETEGAVSEGAVRAMADGVRARYGAGMAVAVSGIAGPAGGSPEKPVGTVWFGFAGPDGTHAQRSIFPGSRHEIRVRAAQSALFGVLRSVRRKDAKTQ
jgi:nicotinamide-nucleotide amidase